MREIIITSEKKSYAMVCAANMNRSMAAHCALLEKGLNVSSFGAGSSVKIPGSTRDDPNVYTFGKASYADVTERFDSFGLKRVQTERIDRHARTEHARERETRTVAR